MCCAIAYIYGLELVSRSLPLKSDTIEHHSMLVPYAPGELKRNSAGHQPSIIQFSLQANWEL